MSITVFVADDHGIVRDGLRALVDAQPDLKVVGHAANGRDAVRQVKELRPDVVVMDIAMPEMNGIEATRQIREDSPATQVVILSIYSTAENVFRSLQAGARGYVLKESAGIEVVHAIRAVHAGLRYLTEKVSNLLLDSYLLDDAIAEAESPLARLSPRERNVLQLVAEGKSSAEIADLLFLSPKTIETYRSRLMGKLGLKHVASLVRFAIQHELTPLE